MAPQKYGEETCRARDRGELIIETYNPEIDKAGYSNRVRVPFNVPFIFDGAIPKEIENCGEPLVDIYKDSIALRDQTALFQAYLLYEHGDLKLPPDAKKVLRYLFGKKGEKANVMCDVCDYNNGDKSMKKVKETDRRVRWIVRPEEIVETRDGWKVKIGEGESYYIVIPESGFVEYTVDGLYNPYTGTPFSTVSFRKEAEKSWIKRGFDPEFARKAVSYFQSRNEGEGISFVLHWYISDYFGRFDVDADVDPGRGRCPLRNPSIGSFPVIGGRYLSIGSFPVSRSPREVKTPWFHEHIIRPP